MLLSDKSVTFQNTGSAKPANGRKGQNIRCYILQAVFIALFSILLYRVWKLQIVDGKRYADDFELKITRTVRDGHTRGNIYDCNGEALAYNKLVYTVTMVDDGAYTSERERQLSINGMIYRVINKLFQNNETICHELKIKAGTDGGYEYTVTGQSLLRFQADIFGEADPDNLTPEQKSMDADAMIQFLSGNSRYGLYGEGKNFYSQEELQRYGLPKKYTQEEILAILGIRYMLSMNAYKKYVPVILAKDVSEKTAAYIMENKPSLTGIDIGKDWERVYTGGEAFSHILGYTGKISSEEMEKYKDSDKGYTLDSVVGKAGIEQYLESELQGTDGERQITVNNVGKIIGEENVIREAVSGRDVYLSVDKNLQIAVYNILEQSLAEIVSGNLIQAKTFDKTHISDTSDIRIPIYDVYIALVNNHVIELSHLYSPDGTELEQKIAKILKQKREESIEALRMELLEGNTDYAHLPKEMQEYITYTVEKTGILNEESMDKEDTFYIRWKNKSGISTKEFLAYGLEHGWVTAETLDSDSKYFTIEEMYNLLIEAIEKKLESDSEFEKLICKWLILSDRITGKDLCMILYDQQVLSPADDDYEKLESGSMDTFAFLKKKIEQLEITPAQLALDPCSASAVVVQPGTGKVLALVSYPGYDNNRLANQMDGAYYNQLLQDQSLPLYNRATQQLTAPGSTFKPITIIAGMQESVISPKTQIFCDGVFDKVEPHLKCWKHSGHGNVADGATALQFSCNDYLCDIAYRLGMKEGTEYMDGVAVNCLQEYSRLFGLNEKSGVEVVESEPHVTDAYGIPSAIGQGTHNYATVQLARYVNIIASKGERTPLTLVKGIEDTDGTWREAEELQKNRIELPDDVWDTVRSGMVQFAQNNSVLGDMGISVAGKTGTAQESKWRPDHAWFVGYAPAEEPKITIAVRIANGYGSSNSTDIGRKILNYYFNEQ